MVNTVLVKQQTLYFYDKNKRVISTKIVSCLAQDLGLGGIANINKTYTAIHLDARTSNKWKGNEVVSNNTVTSDFYKYYGLTKNDVYKTSKVPEPIKPVVKPEPKPAPVTNTSSLKAGTKVTLSNDTLYASAYAKSGSSKSGTYYIYSDEIVSNKVRVTNSASNVGKTPIGSYVSGWVNISDINSETNTNANTKKEFKVGTKITLKSVGLYTSASANNYSSKKSGTYYVYSDNVSNGRIRITNTQKNVGKTPAGSYVTGWVNISDIN